MPLISESKINKQREGQEYGNHEANTNDATLVVLQAAKQGVVDLLLFLVATRHLQKVLKTYKLRPANVWYQDRWVETIREWNYLAAR